MEQEEKHPIFHDKLAGTPSLYPGLGNGIEIWTYLSTKICLMRFIFHNVDGAISETAIFDDKFANILLKPFLNHYFGTPPLHPGLQNAVKIWIYLSTKICLVRFIFHN